jgi:hypothetical protein
VENAFCAKPSGTIALRLGVSAACPLPPACAGLCGQRGHFWQLRSASGHFTAAPQEAGQRTGAIAPEREAEAQCLPVYNADRWALGNQLAAKIVGAVVMALVLVNLEADGLTLSPLGLFILSALGGVLSPVAKDLGRCRRRVSRWSTRVRTPPKHQRAGPQVRSRVSLSDGSVLDYVWHTS